MADLQTVAIAGASGNLGSKITESILQSLYKNKFKQIIILARSQSAAVERLASMGAIVRIYSEKNLTRVLSDVDVLINTVGPAGHHFKEQLLHAILETPIKLYFLSEFGVNHYIHDFPHQEWDEKKAHFQLAQSLLGSRVQLCRVYAGLFLEDSIGPWFGFFTKDAKYEAVGSPEQRTSYTSMYDVGKALAMLASSPHASVPSEVQLSGDSKSMTEIAQIMEAHGSPTIQVTSVPLPPFKDKVLAEPIQTPERNLRFLMGDGKIDHSLQGMGNQNSVIENAQDGDFTWRKIESIAEATKGLPWADTPWAEA
ncbi:isoflavone reductase family protein [Cordyceps fumosorosea ARSEF 2679]|uniref:Isoflavone reductase family protein n=1 Tax=Cordyceps fumosorosea (strain ARSEF 2679) TaxID=1081104 RepID=A0A162MVE6_CORFA|nr:isoflavone reductase family protein [Cordyceps fumosorosea ARSEF 2679]OAA71139.1 isoflavone reductase family protein [Cordyceps fumosorosea ARSEF 2679]